MVGTGLARKRKFNNEVRTISEYVSLLILPNTIHNRIIYIINVINK